MPEQNLFPEDRAALPDPVFAAIPEPVFILDENGYYINVVGGHDRTRYNDGQHLIGKRIHDVMERELADDFVAQIRQAVSSGEIIHYTYQLSASDIRGSQALAGPEGVQWFEAHISPIPSIASSPRMVVWMLTNITRLRQVLAEKDALIKALEEALSEIQTLKGLLPICARCKKVRDDNGYWQQIETYLRAHSNVDFSHSICPECARELYPFLYVDENRGKKRES